MLHIRDVEIQPKGEIEDRIYVRLVIEGLATERAVERLREAVELHYRGGKTVIDGDAAVPVADLLEILERDSGISEGRC
jgi:hypothetical protein